MFVLQALVVLAAIFVGARMGGVGLGVMGGAGLAVLVFVFQLQPTSAPIDVMLMILAVVTAAGALQAAGGLEYLVHVAEKMLRKNPSRITFVGPIVTYLFTLCAGTGHVAYSVMPVIAEVARESRVRPERPMSISAIASQQAITASPISAATVALLALLAPAGVTLFDILKVCIPATFIGCMIGAFVANRTGKNLDEDPEYKVDLSAYEPGQQLPHSGLGSAYVPTWQSKLAVGLFLLGAFLVVLLGSFESLRPVWKTGETMTRLSMPSTIEMVMLTIAAAIILGCRATVEKVIKNDVFTAGAQAVIGIFGVAWMGDTFFQGNLDIFKGSIQSMVTGAPWLFAVALFALSVLLYSQAATVRALMPLGISLGIPFPWLIAMFPSVNGYFFIPNYPTIIAAIAFDRTGTTHIGKYLLNHSFMIPGLVATISAVSIGLILSWLVF
jgi:anaerobic C4-dicarboxylate transporter DcuA